MNILFKKWSLDMIPALRPAYENSNAPHISIHLLGVNVPFAMAPGFRLNNGRRLFSVKHPRYSVK